MLYEIKDKCPECGGHCSDSDCSECNNTGRVTYFDHYDSEADALADYPHSLVRPVLNPMLQGLQELFDKLATVPLSSDQQRDTIEREALNHKESIYELAQHNAELQRRLEEYER